MSSSSQAQAPAPIVLERIPAQKLADILLDEHAKGKIAVVDVRDDDHIGGHIHSSHHVPSSTLDHSLPSLVRKLADKEIVVFHCALSQVRGPKAAARYVRERERLLGPGAWISNPIAEAMRKDKAEEVQREGKEEGDGKEGEWVDVEGKGKEEGERKVQRVLVLERGFEGWQEIYGPDARLTENWSKELWGRY